MKFLSIWHKVGVFSLKIEPGMKNSTRQKDYLSRSLKMKILPHSNVKYSAKTRTYHTPNLGKFYEDFHELFKFEIGTFFQGESFIFMSPIYMHTPFYFDKY